MARQTKTPHQRAEEAAGVAERKVERIVSALTHQREILATYTAHLAEAVARLEYAAHDPALPESRRLELEEYLQEVQGADEDDTYPDVIAAAQAARNAANGDSNDDEIRLLGDALDLALAALGLPIPEPEPADD